MRRLNARNAFATTKPPEQRRIVEGFLGGPLGHERQDVVHAVGQRRDPEISRRSSTRSGRSASIQDIAAAHERPGARHRQHHPAVSDKNTFSIRPNYQYESDENRGVGGTTLASAATTFKHHEQQVTYTQQTILRPTLLNQFQMLFGHEREPTISASAGARHRRRRRVHRRRRAGRSGAHRNAHEAEREPGVDSRGIIWSRPASSCPTGAGAASTIAPTSAARSIFSGLDAYAAGPAVRVHAAAGQRRPRVAREAGRAPTSRTTGRSRPGLSLSFGLRYDWQNYFHDNNNFAPRFSVAFAPGNKKTNVLRAGVGVFNDRSGPVVIADVLHSQPGGLIEAT